METNSKLSQKRQKRKIPDRRRKGNISKSENLAQIKPIGAHFCIKTMVAMNFRKK